MALTVLTAISRVMSRLNDQGVQVILPPDLQPLITDALEKTAEVVANNQNPNIRQLLRKDFTITVSSGTGSLAAAFADAEPPLLGALPSAYMSTSSGAVMQNLPDRQQLSLTRPLGFYVYWINDNGTLRTRNTDGSLTSLSTTVTGTVNYVPAITSINGKELETIFLDQLELMVKERFAVAQDAQAT
jgi:hypothetical protein